ncbi:hypothetical protein ACCT30_48305, partial [Rhizobium ruizarguesonis]
LSLESFGSLRPESRQTKPCSRTSAAGNAPAIGSEEPGFRLAPANYGKKVSSPSGYLADVS